jgi:photosystem II stability/assembly factor-like uncharacterized protein
MKQSILLLLGAGAIIGGIILFNKEDSTQPASNPTATITPEKNITHGHGLAVDVADSQTLYIATHHGLLMLKNERDLFRVGKSHDDFMGFTAHPNDPKIFYSSGHPAQGGNLSFLKSTDSGVTWQKISDGKNGPVDFHAMTVSTADPRIFYGWYQGALQRSDDEGVSWEIVNRDHTFIALIADPANVQKIYGTTPKGVFVSNDKGVTWESLSKELEGGVVAALAINPGNNNEILVSSAQRGGLGKSIDGGKTWQKITEQFNGETVLHIAFVKQQPNTIYLLTNKNTVWKSVDTGTSWVKIF